MQSSGLQLRGQAAGGAHALHRRSLALHRTERRSAQLCSATVSTSTGTSTSGSAAPLPAAQAVANLVEGARRALVLKALKANRAMQRQFDSATLGDGVVAARPALTMLFALTIPPVPGNGWGDLLTNRVFLVGFWAWFSAQFLKIFTKRFKKGVWDGLAMFESGGMPSSHSALCAGITTAIAIQQGLGSPLFAACLCFSVIVMYDAMGVRRHAGKQAEVLNKVIDELLDDDHPMGEVKLKEVLGHTPRQVICGGLLGLAVGLFYPSV